jgi:hypothetical protein
VLGGMQLSKEVSIVVGAGSPSNDELSLSDAIFDPVEAHVYSFRALGLESVIR